MCHHIEILHIHKVQFDRPIVRQIQFSPACVFKLWINSSPYCLTRFLEDDIDTIIEIFGGIGSIPKMKSSLAALKVTDAERKLIMGENARKLYKL